MCDACITRVFWLLRPLECILVFALYHVYHVYVNGVYLSFALYFVHVFSEWCMAQLAARYGITQFVRAPFDCSVLAPMSGTLALAKEAPLKNIAIDTSTAGSSSLAQTTRAFRCVSTAPHSVARPADWMAGLNSALNAAIHLEVLVCWFDAQHS